MTNLSEHKPSRQGTPKAGPSDVIYKVGKIGLSFIPLVGGPLAEIFSATVPAPLSKRKQKWFKSVNEGFEELREKCEGLDFRKLAQDDAFITAVIRATQAAIRNHQEEKLEALRNAVLNAALPGAPGEDLQQIFLNLVDALSAMHIRALKFYHNPREWLREEPARVAEKIHRTRSGLLEYTFPDIKISHDLARHILQDLSVKGLIKNPSLDRVTSLDELLKPHTTLLGKELLEFIASPLEPDDDDSV